MLQLDKLNRFVRGSSNDGISKSDAPSHFTECRSFEVHSQPSGHIPYVDVINVNKHNVTTVTHMTVDFLRSSIHLHHGMRVESERTKELEHE
uniref:Uncharacterized protein n=1 Tax=Ascaris lumbricoides TaxID=6252 RepID=A0A0M3HLF6_ASCLU